MITPQMIAASIKEPTDPNNIKYVKVIRDSNSRIFDNPKADRIYTAIEDPTMMIVETRIPTSSSLFGIDLVSSIIFL